MTIDHGLRLPGGRVLYRRRFLPSKTVKFIDNLQATLMVITTKLKRGEQKERMRKLLDRIFPFYFKLKYYLPKEPEKPTRRLIADFDHSDCIMCFRFKTHDDLRRLKGLLRFPERVYLENRSIMAGEEVFLRGLFELSGGDVQQRICLTFGRELSIQSRAFKWFISHIYTNFQHLVHNSLDWWFRNGFFEKSANAIQQKTLVNLPGAPRVAHFIGYYRLETNKYGGESMECGANARRSDDGFENALNNGLKSIQTVDNAYGMTVDMELNRTSSINDRIAAVQSLLPTNDQTIAFCGSPSDRNDEDFLKWDQKMKAVRISIEWNQMYTGNLFNYLQNGGKLKWQQWSIVGQIYTVATILRNIHIGLYGGQCSEYFNLSIPSNFVEKYINQTDFTPENDEV